jgi:hypothetical protein
MSEFRRGYERGVAAAGGLAGAAHTGVWVNGVDAAVEQAAANLRAVAERYGNLEVHYLKGHLAESWHEGTFNIDAARGGVSHLERLERLGLNGGGSVDLRLHHEGGHTDFQSKYYRSGAETAKAHARPEYEGQVPVVPGDQLDAAREEAARLAAKNVHRPDQAARYADVRDHATTRVEGEHARSQPLDERDALHIAKDAKKGELDPAAHGLRIEDQVSWGDVALQASEAGAIAAAVSAAAAAAPYVARALRQLVADGEIDPEILRSGAWAAGRGAGQGAVRGAIAAGVVAAGRAGLLGEALKNVSPPVVGAVVAVAVSTAADAVALRRGDIDAEEFGRRMTTNAIVASFGTAGAAAGQALIPVPYLGALVGGMVGSAMGSATAGGVTVALDRVSNVEGSRAHAAVLADMLRLAAALEATTATTIIVRDAQARLACSLVEDRRRWEAELRASTARLADAAVLTRVAARLGAEQDRALLAMLGQKD